MPFCEWVAGEMNAPKTGDAIQDRADYEHRFKKVAVRIAAKIEMRSKAHSNLGVVEAPGCRTFSLAYAWARGRWRSLSFKASQL